MSFLKKKKKLIKNQKIHKLSLGLKELTQVLTNEFNSMQMFDNFNRQWKYH